LGNQRGQNELILVDHVAPSERPGLLNKKVYKEFVQASDFFAFAQSFPHKISGVVHMGACSSTTETNEDYLRKNNLEYSQEIFKFCTDRQIPLIYASSGAIYGDGKLGFDDARHPGDFKPLNLYGWSKLNFDIWALQQKKTPPHWYGLRFFNVYGPNEYYKGDMSSVAYKAFQQISANGRLRLFKSYNPQYGDGEQLRDFVYVKDITRWMYELASNFSAQSGIYNMGSGRARSWLDLARAVFMNMNKPMQIEWIEVPENIRDQYQYFTEAKMERLLSQNVSMPKWTVEKGVEDYVRNYLLKQDPYL
jgi:ADP-L-glycero-D-manno-heptose 6-epimerase